MVGDRFHLANYSGTDQGIAKLISVEQIGVAAELDQFHLRFRGRHGVRLSEGLYAGIQLGWTSRFRFTCATDWRG